jgi:DNA-binding response OmpR family regulator
VLGELTVDPESRSVWVAGEPVDLTRTEFDLLLALSARPGSALTRRELMDEVWGEHWVGDSHIVDVHIGNLRRKLGDPADPRLVLTVRGVGYKLGVGA